MDMRVYVLALSSGLPEDGLTLADFTVDIYRITKADKSSSQIVSGDAMQFEIGGGLYGYFLPAIDFLTYDYFAKVGYSGPATLNIKQWLGSDFENAAREATLNFGIYTGDTGLTLADFEVDVYRVLKADKSVTALVSDGVLTAEIGGGFYAYYLAACNFSAYDYLVIAQYIGLRPLTQKLWFGEPVADIGTGIALYDETRTVLEDTNGVIFTGQELDKALSDALIKVSKKSPREVVEALVTIEDSRNVDLSGVSALLFGYDVLSIASPEGVEYPTGNHPQSYRNYKVSGTNLVMDKETAPSAAGEDVNVTCLKAHTVDTLPPGMEPLVVNLAAAYAAINKPLKFLNDFQAETTKFDDITAAIGNMSARITQALADLESGATYITDNRASAVTAIGKMTDRIKGAIADLDAGRDTVEDGKPESLSAIDSVAARITQAIADLASGRALVGDERESATEAIDDMTARVAQAVADIASARTYFNKANIAQPEQEYLASAGQEMQAGLSSLNQAKGYLSEEGGASGGYRQQAVAELNNASTSLSQARAYLSQGEISGLHRQQAVAELNTANSYLSQARGYLQTDAAATQYRGQATGQLNGAGSYLNQARGYLEHFRLRIANINLTEKYEAWGQRMLAQVQPELRGIGRRRIWKEWPKD